MNREFTNRQQYEVIVSDVTYVRINNTWGYKCILMDLFNREIIGYSAGMHKTANFVIETFANIATNLSNIKIFHTDRGSEYDNYLIDETLKTFCISRSLSATSTPYDNAVAEASFKSIKTEFVCPQTFSDLEHLKQELATYTIGLIINVYIQLWVTEVRLNSRTVSIIKLCKKRLSFHVVFDGQCSFLGIFEKVNK